jgi:uncharacterized tellurite resistance protein B-like protein
MKSYAFQNFLFKSAVTVMACDGLIEDNEINEIKNMADNEIYFMGYEYEQSLNDNLNFIKENGKDAINKYLQELSIADLSDKQELLLLEVLIRTIEADKQTHQNEIKFLQMVKAKLKISEEILISKFPNQVGYLVDLHGHASLKEFDNEIKFE